MSTPPTRTIRNAATKARARIQQQSPGRKKNQMTDKNTEIQEDLQEVPLPIETVTDGIDVTSDTDEKEESDSQEEDSHEDSEQSEESVEDSDDEAEIPPINMSKDLQKEATADAQQQSGATALGSIRFEEASKGDETNTQNSSAGTGYRSRRFAITITIPEVDNNADRLHFLVTEVNKFMKIARKKNGRFRLRQFDDIQPPNIADRKNWKTALTKDSSAQFKEYVQGYYSFTAPRGGTYRLRINTVMDKTMAISTFLENVTHDWGQKDTRSITDIKAQHIWDPVKVGYLMRAPRYVTHSYELLEALEKGSKKGNSPPVYFGVSWGTIPSPAGGYDKATAVQAVIIETNRDTKEAAIALLKSWYPLNPQKKSSPPYPGMFRFVINRDNEKVKGNPVALANLSILMERQGIFNKDTQGEQTFCIKDLDTSYNGKDKMSVRDKLLDTKIKTLGDDFCGKPLFLSISSAINNRTGTKSVWFTFHRKVATEAVSIIQNLPAFFKEEWNVRPEYLCYAQFTGSIDDWDTEKRVANNEDTEDIRLAAEIHTLDLRTEEENQPTQEDMSMNSKAEKEMYRMIGNDAETIKSLSKPKLISPTPKTIEVDELSHGGISAVSSRSSVARAKMQQEFDSKIEAQNEEMDKLKAEKEEQAKHTEHLQTELEALKAMILSLQAQKTHSDAQPSTAAQNEQEDPDFESHVEADYQDEIALVANAEIEAMDHAPTSIEIERIYEKAKQKIDEEEAKHKISQLPKGESEDDTKPLTKPIRRLIIQESEEEDAQLESMNTKSDDTEEEEKLLFKNKRLRSQLSDEEYERNIPNTLGRYLKKHNNATGGENPDGKN